MVPADSAMLRLLENSRFEVLPTPSIEDKVLAHLPTGVTVTITASPSAGLEATVALAERLSMSGYTVVPHLAARMIAGRSELAEMASRLDAAGVTGIFVPGGDTAPAGDYPDALALLGDLAMLDVSFDHIGVAGYPEPHPTIHEDLLIQAMWDKRHHATHIVSNLTFSPGAVRTWIGRVRGRRVTMPLLLGIPGPVDRTKLLSVASKIGVGDSTRFLAKNKGLFARLLAPGGFTGEAFLRKCARFLSDPSMLGEGLHVYTFNQVAETAAWRAALIDRLRG